MNAGSMRGGSLYARFEAFGCEVERPQDPELREWGEQRGEEEPISLPLSVIHLELFWKRKQSSSSSQLIKRPHPSESINTHLSDKPSRQTFEAHS